MAIPANRSVRIGDLSVEKKRAVWRWIKTNDPALAESMQTGVHRQLLDMFPGSSVVLDIDTVQAATAKPSATD